MGNENSGDHKEFKDGQEITTRFEKYLETLKGSVKLNQASAGKAVELKGDRIPTIRGFWVKHLKMSWGSWQNYISAEGYEDYFEACKKIQDYCEAALEDALTNGEGNTPGIIFNLKNNYGWKQEENKSLKHGVDPSSEGITGIKFEVIRKEK